MQYTVRVKYDGSVPLQGLAPTVTGQGDATNDSNGIADYARGFVETTVIGPQFGVDTTGVDFGFAPQVALGDFVWKDTNGEYNFIIVCFIFFIFIFIFKTTKN